LYRRDGARPRNVAADRQQLLPPESELPQSLPPESLTLELQPPLSDEPESEEPLLHQLPPLSDEPLSFPDPPPHLQDQPPDPARTSEPAPLWESPSLAHALAVQAPVVCALFVDAESVAAELRSSQVPVAQRSLDGLSLST
jgi:hypothetical protein